MNKDGLFNSFVESLFLLMKRFSDKPNDGADQIKYQNASIHASPDAELEFLWRNFSNLNNWVRFSDTKAAAVLAADGIIVASIATWLAGSHADLLKSPLVIVWFVLILGVTFYSAAYSLKGIMPNLFAMGHKRKTSETGSSLIFFADIAQNFTNPKQFLGAVRQVLADPSGAASQVSQQVWANAKVAAGKYDSVSKAIAGLACSVYIGFIGIIVLAVIQLAKAH